MSETKPIVLAGISFIPYDNAAKRIKKELSGKHRCSPLRVFTPNTSILMKAYCSKRQQELLRSADILLPDGVGVTAAARLRGYRLPRATGIDTAEEILRFANETGLSVYLLGGREGVAEKAAEMLRKKYTGLNIAGTHHGYFSKKGKEDRDVLKNIELLSPDILFVCFGYPLQEAWINASYKKLTTVKLMMGLGGCLDVWSEEKKRAPEIMRKTGLEWLWRGLSEPRRMKEICLLPFFFLRLIGKEVSKNDTR